MVVDDVQVNLEVAQAILESFNLEVIHVENAKKAIELFTNSPNYFDLIFMDLQMPEIDGLQATKIIRNLNIPNAPVIPIVAMTANIFKDDIEQCIKAGMNGHLGKPIDVSEIAKLLAKTFHI